MNETSYPLHWPVTWKRTQRPTRAVRQRCGGTPESAARILRQLRRQGLVEYENTDRAGSLYTVRRVAVQERAP